MKKPKWVCITGSLILTPVGIVILTTLLALPMILLLWWSPDLMSRWWAFKAPVWADVLWWVAAAYFVPRTFFHIFRWFFVKCYWSDETRPDEETAT